MKFFYLIFLLIGIAFAIKCVDDSHCGAPDVLAKCVDGKCQFTRFNKQTQRSVQNNRKRIRRNFFEEMNSFE